ncbi:MAG: hypothetical protein GY856_00945 [bacterium]|nr:hypothetical protein [bacterium]
MTTEGSLVHAIEEKAGRPWSSVGWFWTKTAVSEVDLVVSNRGYHIPFEIKRGRTPEARWLRGLDGFETDHRGLGLDIPYRIVLHFGEPSRPDERTFVLPIWAST